MEKKYNLLVSTLAIRQPGLKKRAEELHISYLLGNDPDGSFTKSLKAIGLPVTAFFNTEGKLSTIHQGPISEENLQKSIMEFLDV